MKPKKTSLSQSLRTWHRKGYEDAIFRKSAYLPPSATPKEQEAYAEGHNEGLAELARKAKAKESMNDND